MNQELAVRDMQNELSPKEFNEALEFASGKAQALKKVVDEQNLSVNLGQSVHLRVEAWETIGEGYGLSCSTETRELYWNADQTRVIGARVYATVHDRFGSVRGGAEQVCFNWEGTEDGREGKSKQHAHQLLGMASTRAVSRALKQVLSWVVVLAGYSPTPWEEIEGSPLATTLGDGPNVCPIHNLTWRPAGQAKELMHIKEGMIGPRGGKQWCKQEDVLNGLDDAFRVAAAHLDREMVKTALQEEYGKPWPQMSPTEKTRAVQGFQSYTAPTEETEAEQPPLDGADQPAY